MPPRPARSILLLLLAVRSAALAQNVKITPLDSPAGELCMRDRATIYPALSGRTMEFDGAAKCVAGC